jgi:hypothetical protein
MDTRAKNIAVGFNILDKVQKLESELLKIEGVIDVDFDLSGFYDNMNEVIFLTKYSIPYEKRNQLKVEVIDVSKANGLKRTGDRIEDYGEHFYFVMQCEKGWQI